MSLSRSVRLLLALVSGVALALAFPSFNIPILGWIAPALLIVAVVGERPSFAFFLGSVQGAAYYGLSLPWFYTVMRQYGPLPVIQAGAVFASVIVVTSLFHAAFAAAIAWLGDGAPERACLAAPFVWVSMDFGLMHLPAIGFPWNLLGYVAAGNLGLVQMTAITGIFGLSLLVAMYNSLAAWARFKCLNGTKQD
jgi:apolipoprotein N-acyltransferase